jgi:hypothetical protein
VKLSTQGIAQQNYVLKIRDIMHGDSKLLSPFPFIRHGYPDNNFESHSVLNKTALCETCINLLEYIANN